MRTAAKRRHPRATRGRRLRLPCATALLCAACGLGAGHPAAPDGDVRTEGYRAPSPAVTRLLTATPPPEPLLHARSGRIALLYREPVIPLAWLARPRLGLAGFRFDPLSRSSDVTPRITRVEVITLGADDPTRAVWRPAEGARLEHLRFSPDGRTLSALRIGDGAARLALFDVERGRERVLPVPVNPAWGDPCRWVEPEALWCRVLPARRGAAPPDAVAPLLVEHDGGPAPTRTYSNLLENDHEDALFEHYFEVELARVASDGALRRVPGLRGLLTDFDLSPDGAYAVVHRLERPYPRLVPARRFPRVVELWDLARGVRLYASPPTGYGVPREPDEPEQPRRAVWKSGAPTVLGFLDETRDADGGRLDRWLALEAHSGEGPREIARSPRDILDFGWTSAGTPLFTTRGDAPNQVRLHAVVDGGTRVLFSGSTAERDGEALRLLRADGEQGAVLEREGRLFVTSDGLGDEGPRPFLAAVELHSGHGEMLFEAEPGVFEAVLGLIDPEGPVFVTQRETETEPPALQLHVGGAVRRLGAPGDPYPALAAAERRVLRYTRADGVALSGTLYLPPGRRSDERLPTLVWIYPYEFTDLEHAERLDLRSFRFHRVKGPSPLAAVIEGYAVLLNPTLPILYVEGATNDDYLPQLVSSAEAAVDHLVAIGVSDPERIAVAGRSYGAFSAANLLIHSRRFATGIAISGAYNRTLTPFGFQHERRSFWDATDLYARISPFFHANEVRAPLLLMHGGADENAGTPPLQARRFFHALVGEGVPVRYVELPHEGHHTWARENVLLAAAEMLDWLDRTIGPGRGAAATGCARPDARAPGC